MLNSASNANSAKLSTTLEPIVHYQSAKPPLIWEGASAEETQDKMANKQFKKVTNGDATLYQGDCI